MSGSEALKGPTRPNQRENALESEESKEMKISNFLAENLPPTEERIAERMHPKCEVCVVLPAYAEREYILRPIASLARQKGVDFDQFELIVVVNNPPVPPERDMFTQEYDYERRIELYSRGIENNQETLSLIRYIQGENVPIDLTEQEREIVDEVRKSGLRVFAIDKASIGKTLPLEDANVGGARNRGVAEAVERFYQQVQRNGIIAQSDAEIRFPETYIKELIDVFKEKADLAGITGSVDYEEDPKDYMLFRNLFLHSQAKEQYNHILGMLVGRSGGTEKSASSDTKALPFDGSNMASRAFETALAGGIPKIPGAEDTEFGYRLARVGKTEKIDHADTLRTITLRRFSSRTTTGRGQVNISTAESIKTSGDVLADSPEIVQIGENIKAELVRAIQANEITPEHLGKIFRIDDQPLLNESQIADISEKMQGLSSMRAEEILLPLSAYKDTVRAKIAEIIKPIPLREAIEKLVEIVCPNQDAKARYVLTKRQMIEKANAALAHRKESLQTLLGTIFTHKPVEFDGPAFLDVLRSQRENLGIGDGDIEFLERNKIVLDSVANIIEKADTQEEAMKGIEGVFEGGLSAVAQNTGQYQMIELEALMEVGEF